jgi:N-methylhydantoinase B
VRRLTELAERLGPDGLRAATEAVLDYAERRTRAQLAAMDDGVREAVDVLEAVDGDLELRLRAEVHGDTLVLDFAGSAPQHAGNLNCPLAVHALGLPVRAAGADRPRHPAQRRAERPLEVRAPHGSLLNAARPPRSPAATSRPARGSPTWSCARSAARSGRGR